MKRYVEVRVRSFFHSKEANFENVITVDVMVDGLKPPAWNEIMPQMVKRAIEAETPFADAALMTKNQIEKYRARQAAERDL